ncbi:MAG: McrB family protein, partial [Minisyncoccia bacterium]
LNEFINKVYGMSISTTTPILLVSNPEKYGVWNGPSEKALKKLGLWKDEWDKEKNNENYTIYNEINNLLIKLRDLVKEKIPEENFDLWKLDSVFGIIEGKNKKTKNKENEEESETNQIRWWVEKTRSSTHKITQKVDFDSSFGKALFSPQKGKNGRDIYANMRIVKKNDRIIHLDMDQNNEFIGISLAKDSVKEFRNGSTPSYYIVLDKFIELTPHIKWDDFKKKYKNELIEIYNNYKKNKMKLFYNKNLSLNQGGYLTEVPKEFIDLLNNEYLLISQQSIPHYNESEKINIEGDNKIPKNIILHGPVGTGKTYFATILGKGIINGDIKNLDNLEELLLKLKKGDKSLDELYKKRIDYEGIKKITFHKSYSYEDFIIGIKASIKDNNIFYEITPGIFKKFCDEANKNKDKNYVLIIDEINRGDISRIFGELITLIEEDKRGMEVDLPYYDNNEKPIKFSVPENLYIIGTMNDSDKSISLVDIALRRRFTFIYIGFSEDVLREWLKGIDELKKEDNIENMIIEFIKKINEKISAYKGSIDFQIGHAFFRSLKDIENPNEKEMEVINIFKYKIFPLLEEYFYNDMDTLVEKILNCEESENEKLFYEEKTDDHNKNYYYYALKNYKGKELLEDLKKFYDYCCEKGEIKENKNVGSHDNKGNPLEGQK